MSEISRLLDIMSKLRDKEKGCKWDLKQTFRSLIPKLVEEVYEVVDAIESENTELLTEELGDMLLHVVFYSQIAKDDNLFTFEDVVKHVSDKLIRRHPHIFSENPTDKTPEEQIVSWNRIKQTERNNKHKNENENSNKFSNVYNNIPKTLPELKRSQKIQHRTDEAIDFLYDKTQDILQDIKDEISELEEEMKNGTESRIKEELGDVIFAMCRVANKFHIDAEDALRLSTKEFERRFIFIGDKLNEMNIEPEDAKKELLAKLWSDAKNTKKRI